MKRRYMVRLANNGYIAEDARVLLSRVSELGVFNDVMDARVASKHVEFDVIMDKPIEHSDALGILDSSIGKVIGYNEIIERDISDKERLKHAKELFNGERYWEAHEMLEGLWKKSKGEEKDILQGLILVCAAFVHAQRAEYNIALSILRRALIKFEGKSVKTIDGIDIVKVIDHVNTMLNSNRIIRFSI